MKGRENENKILFLPKKKQETKTDSGQACKKLRLQINVIFSKYLNFKLNNNWWRYNTTYEAFYQSIKGRKNKPIKPR